jgi:ribosomal protein L37AE/L43A
MLCCPRCGSTEVYVETGGYTGNIYHCKKCGYRGALVLEVEEDKGAGSDLGDMEPGD